MLKFRGKKQLFRTFCHDATAAYFCMAITVTVFSVYGGTARLSGPG